jgi:hypothetical protein
VWGAARKKGDHGGEDVVGVVDEVLAGEHVHEVLIAVEIGGGQGDELAVACGTGGGNRLREQLAQEGLCVGRCHEESVGAGADGALTAGLRSSVVTVAVLGPVELRQAGTRGQTL